MERTNLPMTRRTRGASRWRIGTLALASLGALAPVPAQDGADIETTRTALEEWVEIRRLISQEKRDWALGREMLGERAAVVRRQIEGLRTKISEARASLSTADEKREALVSDNERLKAASGALSSTVASLEGRTRDLLGRLPGPILERVSVLTQRLPEDSASTQASLSERFQNVVGILNEINRFQREVTTTVEVRELGAGRTAEVSVLYAGLGYAWYVSATGDAAGYGAAGEGGWAWHASDADAAAIRLAVDIKQGAQGATYVELPLDIDG